jgi:hypothetical protein
LKNFIELPNIDKDAIIEFELIETTIPWNDVTINPEKFQREADQSYVFASFKTEDAAESS